MILMLHLKLLKCSAGGNKDPVTDGKERYEDETLRRAISMSLQEEGGGVERFAPFWANVLQICRIVAFLKFLDGLFPYTGMYSFL